MLNTLPGTTDVQNTGSGTPVVYQTGTSLVTVKGLTSNSNTITITDNGTSINLEQNPTPPVHTDVENATGTTTGVNAQVYNPNGNPVYIKALSGDGYSNGGVTVTDVSGSQTQLDCTISSVGTGTSLPTSVSMVYSDSSRGGPFPAFSRIKSFTITNNNLGLGTNGLSFTDDGSGSGNIVLNYSTGL